MLIHLQPCTATDQWHFYVFVTLAALAKRFSEIHCSSTHSSCRRDLFWMHNWHVTDDTRGCHTVVFSMLLALFQWQVETWEFLKYTRSLHERWWWLPFRCHPAELKCGHSNCSKGSRFVCQMLSCYTSYEVLISLS